jgi:hypothetical protein
VILFLQEVKLDTIFRHAQLRAPRRQELHGHVQARFLCRQKICALLEYQVVFIFVDALFFLRRMTHPLVHDWKQPTSFTSYPSNQLRQHLHTHTHIYRPPTLNPLHVSQKGAKKIFVNIDLQVK